MIGSTSERFQALVENSPDAIFLIREQGEVVYASASTAKVLGYEPAELLGSNGLDLIHPEDRDRSARLLKKALVEPQLPNRMQARLRQNDGQWLWVESTACNLLDEPHVGAIVLNHREITRRRLAEDERQRQAEELGSPQRGVASLRSHRGARSPGATEEHLRVHGIADAESAAGCGEPGTRATGGGRCRADVDATRKLALVSNPRVCR